MNIAVDPSDVNVDGLSATIASDLARLERVAHIVRQLDEMCEAAARLRARIHRQMRASRAREKTAGDDPAVTTARKAARVRNKP